MPARPRRGGNASRTVTQAPMATTISPAAKHHRAAVTSPEALDTSTDPMATVAAPKIHASPRPRIRSRPRASHSGEADIAMAMHAAAPASPN